MAGYVGVFGGGPVTTALLALTLAVVVLPAGAGLLFLALYKALEWLRPREW